MLHPAPVVLNAGRIEAGESFLYYRAGITPAVAEVVEAADRERVAVAAAYGIQAVSLTQWLTDTYGVTGDSLYEMLQNNAAYANIKSVPSLQNRFLTEDTPSGLVPLEAFGQLGWSGDSSDDQCDRTGEQTSGTGFQSGWPQSEVPGT